MSFFYSVTKKRKRNILTPSALKHRRLNHFNQARCFGQYCFAILCLGDNCDSLLDIKTQYNIITQTFNWVLTVKYLHPLMSNECHKIILY